MRRTTIIATLGLATDRAGALLAMIEAGMDVARLNLSHGVSADHLRRAAEVRELARELRREVAILADLQGPKIRIGKFAEGPVTLKQGDAFILDCYVDAPPGNQQPSIMTKKGFRSPNPLICHQPNRTFTIKSISTAS